jgi:S-adenosyl-L-methionine hydrolase (adenosine-forming)
MPIALVTDFGLRDGYGGIMKGVIAGIAPQVLVIDLSHQIPPQDVAAGRFCLLNAAPYFPLGTIFLGVVDPGVGTGRQAIAVQFDQGYFVGPNNGLGSGLFTEKTFRAAVVLDNPRYWRSPNQSMISSTFHGRDIFAPVAAHLARGVPLNLVGSPLGKKSIINLNLPTYQNFGKTHRGVIQHIDHFGNLISNLPGSICQGQKGQVTFAGQVVPLVQTYGDVAIARPCALIGSHGWLEISVNQGSAQHLFHAQRGDEISYETA